VAQFLQALLWIRINFNADPAPAFCLNVDSDPLSDFEVAKSLIFT
jgi:hypothetical protein